MGALLMATAPSPSLEERFAAKGTSAPIILDRADKVALLGVVSTWLEELDVDQAVGRAGLLGLRDALASDIAAGSA